MRSPVFLFASVVISLGSPIHAEPTFTLTTQESAFVTRPISPAEKSDRTDAAFEVHADRPQQVMEGFGGCFNELGWTALQTLPAPQRGEVLQALFGPDGCNFSICRIPIGANDYSLSWYSHDETPGDFDLAHFSISRDEVFLIPYIRAAMAFQPKLSLWASAWSPPSWMKTSGRYNGGTMRWEKPVLEAYAGYLSRFAQAYRADGLDLRSIHVQNEPGSEQPFPSCVWTGDQIAEFVGDYLGPRFAKDKPGAAIWLGALNIGDAKYSERVLDDPKAGPFIAGAGFQWDGRKAIAEIHKKFPKLPLMETENECGNGSNDWKSAQHTWELFLTYISNGAGIYTYWNMVLDETGLSTWGWKQNAMVSILRREHTVRFNPEFYLMKHLSHFVQPKAVHLEGGGDWKDALAFQNPDGSVAILVANFTGRAATVRVRVGKIILAPTLPDNSFGTVLVPKI